MTQALTDIANQIGEPSGLPMGVRERGLGENLLNALPFALAQFGNPEQVNPIISRFQTTPEQEFEEKAMASKMKQDLLQNKLNALLGISRIDISGQRAKTAKKETKLRTDIFESRLSREALKDKAFSDLADAVEPENPNAALALRANAPTLAQSMLKGSLPQSRKELMDAIIEDDPDLIVLSRGDKEQKAEANKEAATISKILTDPRSTNFKNALLTVKKVFTSMKKKGKALKEKDLLVFSKDRDDKIIAPGKQKEFIQKIKDSQPLDFWLQLKKEGLIKDFVLEEIVSITNFTPIQAENMLLGLTTGLNPNFSIDLSMTERQ